MPKKLTTYLLASTVIAIGASAGYFAYRTLPSSTNQPTPSTSPSPVEAKTKLPQYLSDPKSRTTTEYAYAIRHTSEGILAQIRGTVTNWHNQQAEIHIGTDTFHLVFPDKLKLICQPIAIKTPKSKRTIPNTKTFLDLSRITNYSPNQPFAQVKQLLQDHPNATFLVVDPKDSQSPNTFLVKIAVIYGCQLLR